MFYHFKQNNSGGSWDFDKKRGITVHVVIEAADKKEALSRAENIGLYFDGVENGTDCECCGDRWSDYTSDATQEPTVYGEPVAEAAGLFAWMKNGREIAVHYANGKIEWYGVKKEAA